MQSSSSQRWVKEHEKDDFVKRASREGYRSRAVYKLIEINCRDGLLPEGAMVVDLGSAPGSWSQFATKRIGNKGRVIAVDILPMAPIPGVEFIQGDFRERATLVTLMDALAGDHVSLVTSDMTPNITGVRTVDQARIMHFAELGLEFARETLCPGGTLLIKVFQGEGYDSFVRELKTRFNQVHVRKPKASRPRSREIYLLARDYRV